MDPATRHAQARSFDAEAAAYERGRPPYPAAALDWLLPKAARRVLDLGAGTGKLSRQLLRRGLDVVAVEPLAGMRGQFAEAVPGHRALAGSAEHIPLAARSVDAVLVAQAWHWVDPVTAAEEVRRVLRPGGLLGLVWNVRDERVDWTGRLGALLRPYGDRDTSGIGVDAIGAPFGPVEHRRYEWRNRVPREDVIDLVASRSWVITLPGEERSALLGRVAALLRDHPALAGSAEVDVPYVTHCFRTTLEAPD